ncbi:MAG TPA: ABC transporter permease subunit [Syntrophorhabdaceae bacterium]|nr:ABC transporter permease subunit [Syntrophorhabdaceae bacterium]
MVFRRVLHSRLALAGIAIVALLVMLAAFAPVLAPHDPYGIDLDRRLEGPSPKYPLGTDALGRCLLSRLLYGARTTIGAAFAVFTAVLAMGVLIGIVSGLAGGITDAVIMRVVDVFLAFPSLILAVAVAGFIGPSLFGVLVGVASVWWAGYARFIRSAVLTARQKEYVEGARVAGTRGIRLVLRYIVPQVAAPIIVLAAMEMRWVLLATSSLSFLGLGVQPPMPEWGAMLSDARHYIFSSPRMMIASGASISLAVLGFNLLGEGLRDALQVKQARRR